MTRGINRKNRRKSKIINRRIGKMINSKISRRMPVSGRLSVLPEPSDVQ